MRRINTGRIIVVEIIELKVTEIYMFIILLAKTMVVFKNFGDGPVSE